MKTTERSDDSHARCLELLDDAGYHRINECEGPDAASPSHLEFWHGPRGLLIVQFWAKGGVSIYAEEGIPHQWDDLSRWLKNAT